MDSQPPVNEEEAKRLLDAVEGFIRLRNDPSFALLVRYFEGMAQTAMQEMLDVSPTDAAKIAELQVKAKVPDFIDACLSDLIHEGLDIEIKEEADQDLDALAEIEHGEETNGYPEGE